MSELKDRLLKQLETDYSEDARDCLKIYETIKKLNGGSIPSDQWMVLSRVQHLGTLIDPMRVYSPSEIGYIFLKGLEKDNEMKVLSITEAEARMIYLYYIKYLRYQYYPLHVVYSGRYYLSSLLYIN